MHQYPRPPPTTITKATASAGNAEQTNATRTNNPRDRDIQHMRSTSGQGSGSSEDFVQTRHESLTDSPNTQMQRLNQVIQNFHTKAALIVLSSRVDLPPAYSAKSQEKRVNRWFNIELDETEEYSEDIRRWRKCDVSADRPPPLVIEVFLTTDTLAQGQRLVILDNEERRWDVGSALRPQNAGGSTREVSTPNEVLLERWTIELGEPASSNPLNDLGTVLPLVYKKSIVLFRSLYTYCNFLPTWKLSRKVGRSRSNMGMRIGYRIVDGSRIHKLSRPDNLTLPLYESPSEVTIDYSFGETESPAGPFSVTVQYRENCDFRIDASEELLSSRFIGADDDLFRSSVQAVGHREGERSTAQPGSLPTDRRQNLLQRPELGHAYGSMSTFHQAGFGTGTSPISALRSARDLGETPPSPEPSRPGPPQATAVPARRESLRAAATTRRSSFSFQPFKTPALSASPLGASPLGTSPRGISANHIPTLGSLTEERSLPLPNAQAVAARKSGSVASDTTLPSPTSSSPKPQPVRYSSSFSHRRARLSSGGGTPKPTDDDQTSSGRTSAASATAPPGSAILTDVAGTATSSGSMQEDDEKISDFLKMLDTKKDLLSPTDVATNEASTRRTAAALNRFHQMRDSNAVLSDSMHNSLTLQRPTSASNRASTSSSPIKQISPHTPHTPHMPFMPSRLSAAYSHDDEQQRTTKDEDEAEGASSIQDETSQTQFANAHVPAIDIPNSPRPLLPGFRRSSSAQRRPVSSDEDLGDVFGLRSASMGATERAAERATGRTTGNETSAVARAAVRQRNEASRPVSRNDNLVSPSTRANDDTADTTYHPSSTHQVYRARIARNSGLRGVATPHGSTSSFGGTGGSVERGGDSGGSVSGSWGGRGGRLRSGSRPDNKFGSNEDPDGEDTFLPFALDNSDFNQPVSER